MERYFYIINIAVEAVFANRFRSMLTALGIIFGVAAVIAMLAIGNGAQQEILEQIKLVGLNNIVITPKVQIENNTEDDEGSPGKVRGKFSPGLTLADAHSIKKIIPTVNIISPEVIYDTYILKDGFRKPAKLSGITPDFFKIYNLTIQEGNMFSEQQLTDGKAVCIIGPAIKSKFFQQENPIGKYIKCGNIWLKVIGILENRRVSEGITENLGISNYNNNIYAPIQTVLLRFKDRSVVTGNSLQGVSVFVSGNTMVAISGEEDEKAKANQLDKIVVQVNESAQLNPTKKIIVQMLTRRHSEVVDFEIKIPELLLKQEQKTKDIFNIVLGAIASISLIVGGIGIMNIMLASVMERIKEIGIRMATGATKKDIVFQFLAEAILISITGGLIGIMFGIAFAKVIMKITDILTIVSPGSIIISFGVSVAVGILFGYMPAKKAAEQDPVVSLRHE
ncbi:MAG: ABC transporter permease [Bacteroidales bacterium]|nr:ABC transporter permease [Bacteroidales bacterium]